MPLGQAIGDMWTAIRDRIEVSGGDPVWQVTAGTFDSALGYAEERFESPVVLSRRDRSRWWPRVTLTVTTDPALAASAPPLAELARPPVPAQRDPQATDEAPVSPDVATETGTEAGTEAGAMPASLEAIFAHQEERRIAAQRMPDHDSYADTRDDR